MHHQSEHPSSRIPPTDEHPFTHVISRWGTHSAKWDLLATPLGPHALSLGVADMEFLSAPAVRQAVADAAAHGIYGYTEAFPDLYTAAYQWQERRHHWQPPEGSALFFPRIVQCLAALLSHVLPRQGIDHPRVATLTPTYGPLIEVSTRCGAHVIPIPLECDATGHHSIPWEKLATALREAHILIWLNPHNPTGRVWTDDELRTLGRLAIEHRTLIISDDIHADFTRPGRPTYTPLAAACPTLWDEQLLIHCSSPGKTFNTAGLESSMIFAPPTLHDALHDAKRALGIHNPNYFAIPATIAAWTRCDQWVDALRATIDTTVHRSVTYLRTQLPQARVTDPDGTFLIWVDASPYLRERTLHSVEEAAAVGVSHGSSFGEHYSTHFRVNVALPPDQCLTALERLCAALNTPRH